MTRRQLLATLLSLDTLPALLRPVPPRTRYRHLYVLRFPRVIRTVKCASCWDEFTLKEACGARRLRTVDLGGWPDDVLFEFVQDCPRCGVARASFHDTLPDAWPLWHMPVTSLELPAAEVVVAGEPLTGGFSYVWKIPDVVRGLIRACVPHSLGFYPKSVVKAVQRGRDASFGREDVYHQDDRLSHWDVANSNVSIFFDTSFRSGVSALVR